MFFLCPQLLIGLIAWPVFCGSVPGAVANGVSDDTAAIQRAIDSLPAYGVLDGGSALYAVGTLKLKSRMTMQNFHLLTKPTGIPLTSPVTLDGTQQPIVEVTIRNVHVDGNRARQTNLVTIEDGGRDGFRIVGTAMDIWILNSSAVNCATDGLKLFSADVPPPAGGQNFSNIYVAASRFDNNRRHGASGDSLENVHFLNVSFNSNGLATTSTSTPPNEGERPYLVGGMLYGAGLVLEGYKARNSINGLTIVGCTATGNARFGIQFWDPAVTTAAGFTQRSNIRVEGCTLDGGVSPTHGRQAIEFNVPYSNLKSGYMYRNVTLTNNNIRGTVIANSVSGFRMIGGAVESPYLGFFGISDSSRDVVIQSVASGGKILAQK